MGELNTFPLSIKVSGRRIVIIGGGIEALAKARLVAKTTASIEIFAEAFDADFSGLAVRLVARAFLPSDLDDAALLFVADDSAAADAAMAEARKRRIPVNAVDRPELCDFYVPSIIERAPLTIAIGTEGQAPVLARLIRARIEAALSPRIGTLARLMGSLRHRVAETLHGAEARRYYERLATDPTIDAALQRDGGASLASSLLDAQPSGAGRVYLIGAGPGAVDLLTLRAQRLLQEADVIVHDQLVPQAVVEMGRRDAEILPVGKAKGHHSFTQAQINTLLVRLAQQGKRVVRLKSGDPMVFGRAGEELTALRKAGIAYDIVPGVTAALAAAADAALPVTLRKVSSGVVFATAHGAEDGDLRHWAALAASGITVALYMGKSNAAAVAQAFLAHATPGTTPVGIVVNAGRDDRSFATGTLADLAAGHAELNAGPAIIFIGDAVAAGDWTDAASLAERQFKVA